MYKVETHLHTKYVSRCSHLSAEEIAEAYHKAGYDAIIVTDHYSRINFENMGLDIYSDCNKLEFFLQGYNKLKAACEKYGIHVLKGAEVRFDESDNDYLVYNWNNEMLAEPAKVFAMKISEFYAMAHAAGAVVIQAHPYRKNCTPAIPRYIDGIEILNTHPNHNNRNELAKDYVENFGVIGSCGSDAHEIEHMCRGGIYVEDNPKYIANVARDILHRHFKIVEN